MAKNEENGRKERTTTRNQERAQAEENQKRKRKEKFLGQKQTIYKKTKWRS